MQSNSELVLLYWQFFMDLPEDSLTPLELSPAFEDIHHRMESGGLEQVPLLRALIDGAPTEVGGWVSFVGLDAVRTFLSASGSTGRAELERWSTTNHALSEILRMLDEKESAPRSGPGSMPERLQ